MVKPGDKVTWLHRPYDPKRGATTLTGTVMRVYAFVALIAVEYDDRISYYLVEQQKLTVVETGEE